MVTEDTYIENPCQKGEKQLIKANFAFNVVEKKGDIVYKKSRNSDEAISGWIEESKLEIIKMDK